MHYVRRADFLARYPNPTRRRPRGSARVGLEDVAVPCQPGLKGVKQGKVRHA